MSNADFDRSLTRVLVYEGGKVDDPQDPGGRTNKGITQATFDAYLRQHGGSPHDVYLITNEEVSRIYETQYWDAVKGDELPTGVDLAVFDGAVNSGVGRSVKWLQHALGEHYQGHNDGLIGTKTLQAIEDFADPEQLVINFCSRRLATLQHLKTWKRFGKGWSARISNCQKISVSWCNAETDAPPSVDVSSLMGHRKAIIGPNIDQPSFSPIVTHVVAGAGSVGAITAQTVQQITPVGDTFEWVKYACAGLTLAGVIAGIVYKYGSDAAKTAADGAATATVDLDADAGLPIVTIADLVVAQKG